MTRGPRQSISTSNHEIEGVPTGAPQSPLPGAPPHLPPTAVGGGAPLRRRHPMEAAGRASGPEVPWGLLDHRETPR